MRIIIALHRSNREVLRDFMEYFAESPYDVVARFSPVTIKTEIRRNPNKIALLIVDASFMMVAEEPQITDIYTGPIMGVYRNRKEKVAMQSMGLTLTTADQLIANVEQTVKLPSRTQKARIVACLAMRESGRDRYFKILSKIPGYELVRCANAKQALDTVLSNIRVVALLVVGYDSRMIVAKAYRAGYNGGVLAVCENQLNEKALLDCGLIIAGPLDFQELALKELKR